MCRERWLILGRRRHSPVTPWRNLCRDLLLRKPRCHGLLRDVVAPAFVRREWHYNALAEAWLSLDGTGRCVASVGFFSVGERHDCRELGGYLASLGKRDGGWSGDELETGSIASIRELRMRLFMHGAGGGGDFLAWTPSVGVCISTRALVLLTHYGISTTVATRLNRTLVVDVQWWYSAVQAVAFSGVSCSRYTPVNMSNKLSGFIRLLTQQLFPAG